MPVNTASGAGTPAMAAITATTPETAMVEPTERSIPPVRMTTVMPAARMALMEMARAMFRRLSTRLKLGAMAAIKRTSATSTMRMPTLSHQRAKSKGSRAGLAGLIALV
jgi:hypothetical protein